MLADAALVTALETHALVLRDGGRPVPHASVIFTERSGTTATAQTDDRGRAAAPFAASRIAVSADGCTPETIETSSVEVTVTLHCSAPVIETVRVATGSAETLHRLPVAASTLSAAEIAETAALTTEDLLRLLPGVDRDRSNSQFTNYGQIRVSFTGAGTDRALVLADGIPAQDGFGGQMDWAAYPPEDVTRVELLRGAGSALYGAGAVGGVLSLTTARPESSASGGTIAAAAGSNAYSRTYLHFMEPVAPNVSAALALASQTMSYPALPPQYAGPAGSPAQSRSGMSSLRLQIAASSATTVSYGYRGSSDDQQEGRPNYDFTRRFDQQSVDVRSTSARGEVRAGAYVRTVEITNVADQFPKLPGLLSYTQYVPTDESGVYATWTAGSPRSIFAIRADGRFVHGATTQSSPSGATQYSVAGNQSLAGIGVQETLLGPRSELVGGIRVDAESTTPQSTVNRAVSPRAAFRYDLSKQLSIRISDGSGFRAPYLNELIRGYQIGSTHYLPNAMLVPERSSSLSSGLDWARADSRAAFDVIHTTVNDAIGFRTIDSTHQVRSNVAQTQTDGQTATWQRRTGPCSEISLSETTQYARVTEGPAAVLGKRLPYVPLASATAAYDRSGGRIDGGIALSYFGQTFADDLNTQPLGTAIVGSVHAGYRISDSLRANLNLENAFGAKYLSSIDRYGPPATISFGLSAPIGNVPPETACR